MEDKESTGRFTKKGEEIFVGDRVVRAWKWFSYKGDTKTVYAIHTVVKNPSFLMANGKMHEDIPGFYYGLGNTANSWTGKDVFKLKEKELSEIPENTDFWNCDGNPKILTDKDFFGLTDEQYEAFIKDFRDEEFKLMWGR